MPGEGVRPLSAIRDGLFERGDGRYRALELLNKDYRANDPAKVVTKGNAAMDAFVAAR